MKTKMNVLVTLNSNYVPPLTVMLRSMMDSNPRSEFALWVAHTSLTEEDFLKIAESVDLTRCEIHSVSVPDGLLDSAPVLKRISKETYYRLLAVDYLPADLDRILYIDPDTIILNRLDGFYNVDFGDNLLAGSTHVSGISERVNLRRLNMPRDSKYINAGVMMMNLKGLRYSYTVEEIFDYIEKNGKHLWLADQDVINALYGDKTIYFAPELFNLDEKTCKKLALGRRWIRENTVVVHYDGKYKPWKEGYKGSMSCFYEEYRSIEPVRSFVLFRRGA